MGHLPHLRGEYAVRSGRDRNNQSPRPIVSCQSSLAPLNRPSPPCLQLRTAYCVILRKQQPRGDSNPLFHLERVASSPVDHGAMGMNWVVKELNLSPTASQLDGNGFTDRGEEHHPRNRLGGWL